MATSQRELFIFNAETIKKQQDAQNMKGLTKSQNSPNLMIIILKST